MDYFSILLSAFRFPLRLLIFYLDLTYFVSIIIVVLLLGLCTLHNSLIILPFIILIAPKYILLSSLLSLYVFFSSSFLITFPSQQCSISYKDIHGGIRGAAEEFGRCDSPLRTPGTEQYSSTAVQ